MPGQSLKGNTQGRGTITRVPASGGISSTLSAVAETAYAKCGGLSLAYQVFGDGPVELVFVGPMVSHVELFWTMPQFKAFFEQLATFCRVVMFDKAGVGLSATPSRKSVCSKSERPRSRPSWTPSDSESQSSSL